MDDSILCEFCQASFTKNVPALQVYFIGPWEIISYVLANFLVRPKAI